MTVRNERVQYKEDVSTSTVFEFLCFLELFLWCFFFVFLFAFLLLLVSLSLLLLLLLLLLLMVRREVNLVNEELRFILLLLLL